MHTMKLAIGAAVLAATLTGCGSDPGTRALSGGAIGAGGGALLGAAVGGNPAVGALAGAGVGAIAGAATTPR